MENNEKLNKIRFPEKNLGFILWQLKEIENFYPCYRTMINKE